MKIYTCPVCADKLGADKAPLLNVVGSCLKCPKNHSFDISAKGYVNLLLSQHKNVKDPGDSKEMVAARKLFLNSGAYAPLADALSDTANELCKDITSPVIADCGCGEGYYTAAIYDVLKENGLSPDIYGIDISKNALAAAKARISGKDIFCAAASVFRLPIKSGSVDLATVIFAPFRTEELKRILKPSGCVMTAIPAERHLYGLKELLYDAPRLNEVKDYEIEGLEFLSKREISYTLTLTEQEQLNALFTMTPYYYKTSREDCNKLYSYFGTNDKFETEIAFEILTYKNEER